MSETHTEAPTVSRNPSDHAPRKGGAQSRYVQAYAELLATVTSEGLMRRRYGWYAGRVLLLAGLFAACFTALFWFEPGPVHLLVAGAFGLTFTQTAFLGHDAVHRQIFVSAKRNEWAARFISTVVVGLSYGWWMNKHGKHHANPNKIGKDGDIAPGAIVFVPADARELRGIHAWLIARQHWFFFPLLTLAGLDLHFNALKAVAGSESIRHRALEAVLLGIRLLGFPVLVVLALGPLWALAFLAVQVAVFGVYMGSSFAPNHKGMPIVPADLSIDFLRRQTLMSRNISGGRAIAVGMGGLNYQIEHHLFPAMPSINLGRARAFVKPFCAAHGVSYSETTLFGSYRIVLAYLQRVGLGHADPFACPLAGELRAR